MPDNQPEVARVLPGDTGDDGFVGGPYRNCPGLDRGPVDTLGVGNDSGEDSGNSLPCAAGYTLMLCSRELFGEDDEVIT